MVFFGVVLVLVERRWELCDKNIYFLKHGGFQQKITKYLGVFFVFSFVWLFLGFVFGVFLVLCFLVLCLIGLRKKTRRWFEAFFNKMCMGSLIIVDNFACLPE